MLLWLVLPLLALVSFHVREGLGQDSSREFEARRKAYCGLAKQGITVLFNASEDEDHVFRSEKNFYYLTGYLEPRAILVLSSRNPDLPETLFIPEREPEKEKWSGPKMEPNAETAGKLGVSRVLGLNQFQAELLKLAASESRIYTLLPRSGNARQIPQGENPANRLQQLFPFVEILDARPYLAQLRMKKSTAEVNRIRRAIDISIEAHRFAAPEIRPTRYEYEVQAAIEYQFRRRGASGPAFPSIIGSGPNSNILHYDANNRQMQAGELVVVDVGAEYGEYSSDITRTYPVSGKFTARQKEIYDIVLGAQEAALREVKPGATLSRTGTIHKAAYDYIDSHGKDSRGNSLGRYFIHGTSHHLGLEVHDAASDEARPLETGMVITVEPGIYLPEEGFGVRIEDDVLVTPAGCELLSEGLPRRAEDLERFIQECRR
jgi:Xaa-Pro aminopeptidase